MNIILYFSIQNRYRTFAYCEEFIQTMPTEITYVDYGSFYGKVAHEGHIDFLVASY